MHKERLLDRLNRRFGRYSIENLMMIVVGAMALVYLMDLMIYSTKGISILSALIFDRDAIFAGQIWRVLTFIFLPPDLSLIFIIFSLYFYWLIGSSLEAHWGSFRFNVFYLCGIIGTIIAGLITGYATNSYLNLSLFLAFALMFPDFELMLFFFIPIKVKYLAILDLISLTVLFITSAWPVKVAILVSLANVLLFFGRDFIGGIKNAYRRLRFRRSADKYWKKRN